MTAGSKGPTRILHVVEAMERAGLETWLMHVLRHLDRERFHMDFMVQRAKKAAYDDEIRELGSGIFLCSHRRQLVKHDRDFRRILREQGPYDIIHGHLHHYDGYVLRRAHQAGIPVRIAHSHSNVSVESARRSSAWKMYGGLMSRWIHRHATVGLAASREAARALFGPGWEADPRWRVLPCGIDLEPFRDGVDHAVRAELGIPADVFVIGHVGRFAKGKNHEFLVEVASEVIKREPRTRLLMVGRGPLRAAIENQVAKLGVSDKVVFAGVRPDVPRLMLGAMDVFVFPSLYEGLGLVGVEAQAAGLSTFVSDVVPEELDVVGSLIQRLSLSQPASVWAEAILAVRNARPSFLDRQNALRLIKESRFDIDSSVKELERVYGG